MYILKNEFSLTPDLNDFFCFWSHKFQFKSCYSTFQTRAINFRGLHTKRQRVNKHPISKNHSVRTEQFPHIQMATRHCMSTRKSVSSSNIFSISISHHLSLPQVKHELTNSKRRVVHFDFFLIIFFFK